MTRVIITGPARSGKTAFAKMLAEEMNTRATDTSEPVILAETARLRGLLRPRFDGQTDADRFGREWDVARNRPPRRNLVAMGNALHALDLSMLGRYCFSLGDICCGVRGTAELQSLLLLYPSTLVVRMVVGDDVPHDPDDNYDIDFSRLKVPVCQVHNVGTLADLQASAKELASRMPFPRPAWVG